MKKSAMSAFVCVCVCVCVCMWPCLSRPPCLPSLPSVPTISPFPVSQLSPSPPCPVSPLHPLPVYPLSSVPPPPSPLSGFGGDRLEGGDGGNGEEIHRVSLQDIYWGRRRTLSPFWIFAESLGCDLTGFRLLHQQRVISISVIRRHLLHSDRCRITRSTI